MKELTSCSKKSSLFLSTLSALCESCFPYCSESSVQAGFCFVFPDTSYFHSHLGSCSSRGSCWCVQSDEVLLFPCTRLLVVNSLFSISINSSEISSNLPKDFEYVLPTKGAQVDTLIFLTDG